MEAKSESKEMAEFVAVSPNWCGGLYHRLDCTELPRKYKTDRLCNVIDEMQGLQTRYPCPRCQPPTAGRKFWHTSIYPLGLHHSDPKCPDLDHCSTEMTQLIHTGRFKGFCSKCVKLESLVHPEPA